MFRCHIYTPRQDTQEARYEAAFQVSAHRAMCIRIASSRARYRNETFCLPMCRPFQTRISLKSKYRS